MTSPYTVVINGVPIQCETAEAALQLATLHGADGKPNRGEHRHSVSNGTRWTDQRVAEFYKLIEGTHQRRLIDIMLTSADPLTDAQLVQKLGLNGGPALGGVLAGLFKNARKVGADPKELYARKQITMGDKRGYEYTLHDGFRKAAERRIGSK